MIMNDFHAFQLIKTPVTFISVAVYGGGSCASFRDVLSQNICVSSGSVSTYVLHLRPPLTSSSDLLYLRLYFQYVSTYVLFLRIRPPPMSPPPVSTHVITLVTKKGHSRDLDASNT